MKNFIGLLGFLLLFSSCSEFQKALKSEDIKTKYELGSKLYEEGKWNKANRLFAQIVPKYKGKPQAEKLMWMFYNTSYMMEDYHISAYHFDRYATSYPNSEKAEEAAFLAGKSLYKLSPIYSKEQKETIEAIEKLQLFINRYPESQYLSEANEMVKELDFKLEKKAFEIARQYNYTARVANDYEACIKSMDNLLVRYPGTTFREQALYWKFDSAYKLATNSVEFKKKKRIETALVFFNNFKKGAKDAELLAEAEEMHNELLEAQKQYDTKS